MFHSMNTTATALTAQRLRMDVISSNIANADTTRATYENGEWQPYKRKSVALQQSGDTFSSLLSKAKSSNASPGSGVTVSAIRKDTETPGELLYDPAHQDANEEGYVELSNVDPLREMVDLMSATRSYEANVTVFNANKSMMMRALQIGKS
ncbi:flagellar basal body rod protein FlgC [Jeotgalibacillus proteolyticus]|uniref:Flagellar basal-body rod protein FlgC n=1 Tax=Jeotgalibacillus proteolyticus TaxID=2082395 RepID=A0A2S5GGA1_9BACL|nr:flagellar basal body rod protein FlgC [Jeotgalibacillus proteolyticus]PPA72062.1 flagellar basal body rod protein FlgC [Jeotgalibacillus proteolyticus]